MLKSELKQSAVSITTSRNVPEQFLNLNATTQQLNMSELTRENRQLTAQLQGQQNTNQQLLRQISKL